MSDYKNNQLTRVGLGLTPKEGHKMSSLNMKQRVVRTAGSWALLIAFMMLCRPQSLPVALLIVPFVLLFVALMSLWGLLQALFERNSNKDRADNWGKRLKTTVCSSLVLLLILQSLGQLTARDVLTITAIAIIGYLYIGRSRSESNKSP